MQTSWMGREGAPGHVQLVQTGGGVTCIITIVISIFTRKRFLCIIRRRRDGTSSRTCRNCFCNSTFFVEIHDLLQHCTCCCETLVAQMRRLQVRRRVVIASLFCFTRLSQVQQWSWVIDFEGFGMRDMAPRIAMAMGTLLQVSQSVVNRYSNDQHYHC